MLHVVNKFFEGDFKKQPRKQLWSYQGSFLKNFPDVKQVAICNLGKKFQLQHKNMASKKHEISNTWMEMMMCPKKLKDLKVFLQQLGISQYQSYMKYPNIIFS